MAETGWWFAVLAGVAVGDALLFWLGYTWHRRGRMAEGAVNGQVDPTALRQDIDRFNAALNAIQLCITGVEEKVGRLQGAPQGRPQAVEPRGSEPRAPESPLGEPEPSTDDGWQDEVVRIAQRLARLGASTAELSRACNIPPGEAQLISRLTRLGGTAELPASAPAAVNRRLEVPSTRSWHQSPVDAGAGVPAGASSP
jgi:hypothetical protein